MAINNRQTNLFAVEDWKKLYTTFSEADFQSYDFETIRKVMVDYLRTYYAEDYNDFIESSEFVALIDLVAFQAQSLAFRTDLNARENFLETAERKDSVLKLVKQLNYNPNRNKAANGLLKIQSISTSESVFDYSSNNLSRTNIIWNDPSNPDWSSQFSLVLNAALSTGQRIGKPFASKNINGIKTEQYNVAVPTSVAQVVFPFNSIINDNSTPFEIVSATITNSDAVTEQDPGSTGAFGMLFQNDGRGNASSNTGYFVYFKQGKLNSLDIAFTDKIPNRVLNVNVENINNEDIWLYELASGLLSNQWTKISNVSGSNAIYNSTARGIRTLFSVNTRSNDQIDLVFGDDTFANTPLGNYRVFFRVSNGLTYRISPADLSGITIVVPYISKTGKPERLTITASLQYTVANSSRRDLIQEIKDKAPQNFYSQNRMVNGEDYNIVPYATYADIVKVKSVNRYSSGISRYLDIIDPTGKYSSTDLFGSDGSFYKNETLKTQTFTFSSRNDILRIIENTIQPIVGGQSNKHFYYEKYSSISLGNLSWVRQTDDTSTSTGFFKQVGAISYEKIGNFSVQPWRYLLIESLIKFTAPYGQYFDSTNSLTSGTPRLPGDKTVIWATIKSQIGDGSNPIYLAGREIGGVTISDNIPTGALVTAVYAPYTINFTPTLINTMTTYILNNVEFGLRYDYTNTVVGDPWKIVQKNNIDTTNPFSLTTAGSSSDTTWLIKFTTDGVRYTMEYRGLDYIFSSTNSIRFLNTNPTQVYDSRTNSIVKDNIRILQTNLNNTQTSILDRDIILQIYENEVEADGYTDSTKVKVTFPTGANSDLPLDPEIFSTIVGTFDNTYAFYEKYLDYDNLVRYQLLDSGVINYVYSTKSAIDNVRNNFSTGRVFYASAEKKFYQISTTSNANTLIELTGQYIAYIGRQNISFQYKHNASDSKRIDPAASNLIDCYILTRSYDEAYRNYITDYTGKLLEPMQIDSVTLNSTYNQLLQLKMISDELILNSGVYKPLFGAKSVDALQATFQIVKNPSSSISSNELKSKLIEQINNYFALENWDFGDTFYFSELSAYLHSKLGTHLSSVILIPTSPNSVFGNLYEIRSQPNEILISAATVDNVEVVSGVYVGIDSSGVNTIYATQFTNGTGV